MNGVSKGNGLIEKLDLSALWQLLQLSSPALPVGAYSYSEGLEVLAERGLLRSSEDLYHWLELELCYGSIPVEGAVLVRAYRAMQQQDSNGLQYWNQWWSALRETEELRQQSWQMGRSLVRLGRSLDPRLEPWLSVAGEPCNFVIAFGTIAAYWKLPLEAIVAAYLYSWLTNLVNAGVKLIPLGQTAGQQMLLTLQPALRQATTYALTQEDEQLGGWSHGLAIVSTQHETLYTRLFQS